jgi:hydroxyacylglutathione hydrolase
MVRAPPLRRCYYVKAESVIHPDPPRNRESMRRLAALEPELVCFGHGAPLRNPGKLMAFTNRVAGR